MQTHKITFLVLLGIQVSPAFAFIQSNATDVWTNSGHTTVAKMNCYNEGSPCWLTSGTYYDSTGTFRQSCTGAGSLVCDQANHFYDIGFEQCVDPDEEATSLGYVEFDGDEYNPDALGGATAPGEWAVEFSYGEISGIASCGAENGTYYYETTPVNFRQNTDSGSVCWCKMTYPGESQWWFVDSACTSDCPGICAREISYGYDDIYTLYNSVGSRKQLSCPSGQYDIGVGSCVASSTNARDDGYYAFNSDPEHTDETAKYSLTTPGQWAAEFSYGTVKGVATCLPIGSSVGSSTSLEYTSAVTGNYCWCKMTSPSTSAWVYFEHFDDTETCAALCPFNCADDTSQDAPVRVGMYNTCVY